MDEYRQKKIIIYALTYIAVIEYFIFLLLISIIMDFNKNSFLSLIIFGVFAIINIIIAKLLIKDEMLDFLTKKQLMVRLALAHIPSLLGLVAALIYLFIQ